MASAGKPNSVGILGHFGGNNHGDECTMAAVIQNLRRHFPDVEIRGFTLWPAETEARHGIPSFSIRRRSRSRPHTVADPKTDGDWRLCRSKVGVQETKGRISPAKAFLNARAPFVLQPIRSAKHWAGIALEIAKEPYRLICSYRALRGVDLLILAGSQPLIDSWNGAWYHPYHVLRWSMLARWAGTRFATLCVGAGPLNRPLGRRFVRLALGWTTYRSYRDAYSANLIESLGVPGPHRVFPDLVFSLDLGRPVWSRSPNPASRDRKPIIGLNPMSHEDPRYIPLGERRRYRRYVEKLADFAEQLIREGYPVRAFSSDIADARVCAEIREMLEQRPGLNLDELWDSNPVLSFEELMDRLQGCDMLVAARFHCLVLSSMIGRPVLALSYNRKVDDLMESLGQSDCCLNIDNFEVPELIACLKRAERRRDEIAGELLPRAGEYRRSLNLQYVALFGPEAGSKLAHPAGFEPSTGKAAGAGRHDASAPAAG